MRVSCIRGDFLAEGAAPKPPVLLRQLIAEGKGGKDGELIVSDTPHFIADTELDKARRIVLGEASQSLPVVYVSSRDSDELPLNPERLAADLAGMAHVIAEPDRAFSFRLRDATQGQNAYAGAVGLGFPGKPTAIRVFPSREPQAQHRSLVALVRETSIGRLARLGAEWEDLQHLASAAARARMADAPPPEESRSDDAEWRQLYEGEIADQAETIRKLRQENGRLQARLEAGMTTSSLAQRLSELKEAVGEIYEGELLDRLRNAVAAATSHGFAIGDRDRAVMEAILPMFPQSHHSERLVNSLDPARDNARTDATLKDILVPLGFRRSDEGRHIKFIPPEGLMAVKTITIAKTASDHRAGLNTIGHTKDALGLFFAREK